MSQIYVDSYVLIPITWAITQKNFIMRDSLQFNISPDEEIISTKL